MLRLAVALAAGLVLTPAHVAAALPSSAARDVCALRARVNEPAQKLIDEALHSDGRAKACLLVVGAVALEREGKTQLAAATLRTANVDGELADIAPDLEARAVAWTTPKIVAPPPGPPQTADEAAERVMRLIGDARPKEAAELAVKFPRGPTQHDPLEVATVTALVRASRMDEALARAFKLSKTDATLKVRAWALSKAARYVEARDTYTELASVTADPALKAEATFYAGFASWEADDLDAVRAHFESQAVVDAVKASAFEANARWYLAFASIRKGDHAAAVPVLEALVNDLPGDKEYRKHRYWLARERIAAGNAQQGLDVLRAVVNEDSTDWYGLLGRRRLKMKPIAGKKIADDAVLARARTDAASARPRLLWNLGLDAEAIAAARVAEPTIEDAGLAQSFGDYFYGYRRGPTFLPFPRTKGGSIVATPGWRASYAAPHRALVDAAAKQAGIEPAFIYAIVRTESGFDPKAVSVAGARGLTQLLPSVARTACALRGRPTADADRLFEPEVSLDLGATVLALHKKELGSTLLAAAAYNGAPENVAQWMKAYGDLEVETFVERIPFRETRDYVKKVLATEAVYRALDGQPLALDLPATIGAPPASLTVTPYDR